jgi:hypothetical protein
VVTNVFSARVMLTTIEVMTLDGDSLLSLAGDDLVAATQPLLGLMPPGGDSRLWHGSGDH